MHCSCSFKNIIEDFMFFCSFIYWIFLFFNYLTCFIINIISFLILLWNWVLRLHVISDKHFTLTILYLYFTDFETFRKKGKVPVWWIKLWTTCYSTKRTSSSKEEMINKTKTYVEIAAACLWAEFIQVYLHISLNCLLTLLIQ